MSEEHQNDPDITITLTEQQVFDELSGCNAEFSAQTMQLITEFITQLAARPDHCLTRELTLPKALELLASIVSGLWGTYLEACESGAHGPAAADEDPRGPGHGKLKIVLEAMRLEQVQAVREEQPVFSTYYLAAMSAICSSSHGLDAFRRYVRQCTRTHSSTVPARPAVAPKGSGESDRPLSATQQRAYDFCLRIGRLFYEGQSCLPNIKIRCFPLIAGPTGAGKTHVVRQLAEELDCHYMRLDYGTWLPQGARESPNTMEAICEAALKYERVLVHLDELDKLRGDFGFGWEISVKNDIWRLLDRPIDLSHVAEAQRFEEGEKAFAKMFAQRVWIVGSGTWQEVFDSPAKSIGFASGSEDRTQRQKEMIERIHESRLIAPELTGRFNSKLQLIDYPKVEEVTQLLAVSGIELADAQIEQLRETMPRSGFRAVEDTVTDVALQRFEDMQREAARTQSEPEFAPEPERLTLHAAAARAETTDEAYEDDLGENEEEDGDFEADHDPWGPVIEPGFYTVNFPFSERMRYVSVSYAWGGRLKLKWYRSVHGLQCSARDGFNTGRAVRSCEPVKFMELWPQFARKYELNDYTEVDVGLFRSWNPQPCQQPAVADLHSEPSDLYRFWQQQRRDHDAELERLREIAAEMHATIHPQSDSTEHLDRRYDLSEALLCSTARAKPAQAQPYSGPNLVELRAQYEKFVNEGLEWFRWHIGSRDIDPAQWSASIQKPLIEWERLLVNETAKDIARRSLVCETVNCPLKMRQTMDLFEPDLSWDAMPDAVRNRYLMLFHPYLTPEAAA